LVTKFLKRKDTLEDLGVDGEHNIESNLNEIVGEGGPVVQDTNQWWPRVSTAM
jgi:hypothetical protein